MFDKNSVYLPTKKIGKNNPKAAEIEADNTARQEWNRTADLALISGIEEAKILEIKQTEIHDKAGQSIRENGWLPNLFRGIVGKAKEFLQAIIREKDMPPKPVLNMDMDEFRTMQTLMLRYRNRRKQSRRYRRSHSRICDSSLRKQRVFSRVRNEKLWKNRYSRSKPNLMKNWINSPIF